MMTISLDNRYAGTLLGAACGDALGATLEFKSRQEIERRYPHGFRDIIGGGWLDLQPGETTDDTAMMLAIARACTPDGIDLDGVARIFLLWMESGPKDIGNQTRLALNLLHAGRKWDEAGEELHARSERGIAGNGAVMRCAPVALRFRSSPDRLVRAAMDTSRITHADPRSTWSCVVVCQAIVHLLEGGDRREVVGAALRGVDQPDVVDAVSSAASGSRDDVRSGGYVLETVNAAFWCLLHGASAEDVIVQAVMLGDDADTTGTVAGALAGAAYGADALPQRWLQRLHGRSELEALAISLRHMVEADRASRG